MVCQIECRTGPYMPLLVGHRSTPQTRVQLASFTSKCVSRLSSCSATLVQGTASLPATRLPSHFNAPSFSLSDPPLCARFDSISFRLSAGWEVRVSASLFSIVIFCSFSLRSTRIWLLHRCCTGCVVGLRLAHLVELCAMLAGPICASRIVVYGHCKDAHGLQQCFSSSSHSRLRTEL